MPDCHENLKWCDQCGEGVTSFCRSKVDKESCKIFSLKPCPCCGSELDSTDSDTLHPSMGWRDDDGFRHYMTLWDERGIHGVCYSVNCVQHYGGCGLNISGDSMKEAIEKWNTRKGLK